MLDKGTVVRISIAELDRDGMAFARPNGPRGNGD